MERGFRKEEAAAVRTVTALTHILAAAAAAAAAAQAAAGRRNGFPQLPWSFLFLRHARGKEEAGEEREEKAGYKKEGGRLQLRYKPGS